MLELLEILKYVVPSIVVFITAYYLLKIFLEVEEKKLSLELKMDAKNITIPIRLQAFERFTMYLERINPTNMVMRLQKSTMNNSQFQMLLISTVRNEFEHNVSQQMYISSASWEAVKSAKEETIKVINLAFGQIDPSGPSIELATKIIELTADDSMSPSDKALELLKKDIRQYF
ncbi:MAG: hypothetical protein PHR79_11105 [Bacteroidales bacterium]|nr:hypothetical protein [Bacteroidales bacterium]